MDMYLKQLFIVGSKEKTIRYLLEQLPDHFRVGDRDYDLLSPFQPTDRELIPISTIIERGEKMGTDMGEEDARYIKQHCDDLPEVFYQYNVLLLFPMWRSKHVVSGWFGETENMRFYAGRGSLAGTTCFPLWTPLHGGKAMFGHNARLVRRRKGGLTCSPGITR